MSRPGESALALLLALVAAANPAPLRAQRSEAPRPFSFVVLGHIRGGVSVLLNPKLGGLLQRVRGLHPDFVVLTGDIIWGDVAHEPSRPDVIEAEWNAVDSALAELRVPVYRVPGNHDINDIHTRDIWMRRYGALPRVVTYGSTRLLLLTSSFIPPDGDTTHQAYIGGVDIDSAQLAFVRRELADSGFAHTWVFMHHNLWWQPDSGRWWREVHPLLAAAHVDNVFSGDYGPMKFSTKERDGVRDYQGSMELQVDIPRLQRVAHSRELAGQLDVFLHVRVAGDSSSVSVVPVAELAGDWTPERYRLIHTVPVPTRLERIQALLADRTTVVRLLVAGMAALLLGGVVGWRLRGRRPAGTA